jgi:hypothetical protein
LNLYNIFVKSVLKYGNETHSYVGRDKSKIEAAEMRNLTLS